MESALLVSGSEKGLQQLKPLLERLSGLQVVPVASGSEARRRLAREEYALAVINGPLQEELGQELALWIAEGTACGVVLLLRREEAEADAEDSFLYSSRAVTNCLLNKLKAHAPKPEPRVKASDLEKRLALLKY